MEIINAHAHIYPEKIAQKATDTIGVFYDIKMEMPAGTAERLLIDGGRAGISRYVVHSVATTAHQVRSINEFILRETRAHPEFIGFITLHPETTFIAAHFGGYRCWDDAVLYRGLTNVYFDTCSSLPFIDAKRARELIDLLGADRFFFATDFPMWDSVGELEHFLAIPLSDTEREAILGGNIKRLLGLV